MAFQNYYTNLFTSCEPIFPEDFQSLIRPCIEIDENNNLNMIPTEEEIQAVIFSMGSNKSPCLDGMTTNFYKAYWSIVKEDVIYEVKSLQNRGYQGCL